MVYKTSALHTCTWISIIIRNEKKCHVNHINYMSYCVLNNKSYWNRSIMKPRFEKILSCFIIKQFYIPNNEISKMLVLTLWAHLFLIDSVLLKSNLSKELPGNIASSCKYILALNLVLGAYFQYIDYRKYLIVRYWYQRRVDLPWQSSRLVRRTCLGDGEVQLLLLPNHLPMGNKTYGFPRDSESLSMKGEDSVMNINSKLK